MNDLRNQTILMIKTLAGAMTPTTLAAIIADIDSSAYDPELIEARDLTTYARRTFRRQLVCLVGEAESEKMISEVAQ